MGAGEGKLQEGRQLQEHRPQRRGRPAQGGGGRGLGFSKNDFIGCRRGFYNFLASYFESVGWERVAAV